MTVTRGPLLTVSLGIAVFTIAGCGAEETTSPQANSTEQETEVEDPAAGASEDTVEGSVVDSSDEPTPVEEQPASAAYNFSDVSPIVQAFIDEQDLNGAGLIVVHRDDGIIHHDHWGDFEPDRISLIASSSKMITAGVLLRLDDDGLLDLDAPVADVVEWGAANPDITPAQLISNSSGLVGLLPNPLYGPYLCQYVAAGTLQACAERIFTTGDDDDDIAAPDSEYRYGGAQWQVAGGVAEAASEKSWAQLIDEIYVQPCGLDALSFNNHFGQLAGDPFKYPDAFAADPSNLSPSDNPNMEGGAYITTGDYGALLLMHLRSGMCGDVRVLSEDAVDRMHADRIAVAYDGDAWNPDTGYGMGWWVDRETGRISDGGAYGSVPWLDLDDGYGAYLVVEADSATGNALADQLYALIESAVTGR